MEGANVHDVASLLKQFMRELSEPLLTRRLASVLEACAECWQGSEGTRLLALVCLLLPTVHLKVSVKQHRQSTAHFGGFGCLEKMF